MGLREHSRSPRGRASDSNILWSVDSSAGYRHYLTRARVREFSNEKGWGVLDSLSGGGSGIWFHWSVIEVDGYKTIEPGVLCEAEVETAEQDGYHLRAVAVRPET
jgi:cold shock protein